MNIWNIVIGTMVGLFVLTILWIGSLFRHEVLPAGLFVIAIAIGGIVTSSAVNSKGR